MSRWVYCVVCLGGAAELHGGGSHAAGQPARVLILGTGSGQDNRVDALDVQQLSVRDSVLRAFWRVSSHGELAAVCGYDQRDRQDGHY